MVKQLTHFADHANINFLIKRFLLMVISISICDCLHIDADFKPEKYIIKRDINKIKIQNEYHEYIHIKDDCLDINCACEGEMCEIKNNETETTDDGYMFNSFSTDILDFLNQGQGISQNNTDKENNNSDNENKPIATENNNDLRSNNDDAVKPNAQVIDLSALHEVLKIKDKKASITEINERIKITPKFVIITNTKSKIMMNMSVSF